MEQPNLKPARSGGLHEPRETQPRLRTEMLGLRRENDRGASECWLCQRRRLGKVPGLAPETIHSATDDDDRPARVDFGLDGLDRDGRRVQRPLPRSAGSRHCLAGLCLAGLGDHRGEGGYRRRRRGESMSGVEKVLRIIGLTIMIPVLLIIALAAALFVICSASGPQSNPAVVITIMAIVAILVVGFMIAALSRS